MSTTTFIVNDTSTGSNNPLVQVQIAESSNGTLAFTVTQLAYAGAYLGDLRGLFFDIARESLIGTLSVVGAPAYFTEIQQGNDNVRDLGNGANMQGLLGSDGGYDVGIEIGTSGIGKNGDDVRSFNFTLRSSTGPLTLADFANVDFGVRITSVGRDIDGNGTIDTTRNDSAKIGETTGPVSGNTDDGDATVGITGTAQEDSVLTGNFGDDDPDGAATNVHYQWQRSNGLGGWVNVGSDQDSYTLSDADVGQAVRVVVSYTDGQGFSETIESPPTAAVAAVNDPHTGAAAVAGTATEDQVLTADTSPLADADGLGAFSYQWQRSDGLGGWTNVGLDQASYTLSDDDVGQTIRVIVSYTDGQGFAESSTSDPTAAVSAVNDPHTGAAVVAGTATEDQVLTADTSGLADADGLGAFSYQWQRSDGLGGWTNVGLNQDSYTLGDTDVGFELRVVVSYTDGQGFAESSTSDPTAAVSAVNDPHTGAAVVAGTAAEDQVLTADTSGLADADGLGAFSYQWQRSDGLGGWTNVGLNQDSYTLGDTDVGFELRVVVSYTDGQGFAESSTSDPTAAVSAVNDPHTGVAAVAGTATEDQVLTADTSGLTDADGLGAFGYQWQRGDGLGGWTNVGSDQATYTLGDADVGFELRVVVSYTDGQGFAESSTSDPTAAVVAFDDGDATVTISGTAQEDSVLTANFGNDDPDGAASGVTYQWQRNGVDILTATNPTYTLGDADVGQTITVEVDYTDGQGFIETIESVATAIVTAFDDGDATVTISGTAQEDTVLTANFGNNDPDGAASGVAYQWQRNGVDILTATNPTYTLVAADVGATITVEVDYTDGQGFIESIESAPTAPVAPNVDINDAPNLNTAANPALAPVLEDAAAPAGAVGTLVSALVDLNPPPGGLDNVTDPDSGAVTGIAITATGANGTWSYSLNNGGTWTAVGAVSTASALLLAADANTRLYFRPNANFDGDSTITFRAWDQTTGTAGTKVNTTVNGGTTAFSTATDIATIDVTPVNDAPAAGNDVVARNNQLSSITIPEIALLRNDSDIDSPTTLDVNGVTGWSDFASVALSPGGVATGFLTVNESGGVGGTFTYQAADGALLSGNATVSVGTNVSSVPFGTGWDVIGNVGSTILIGTAGTDRLFASTGNDTLYGGPGNDPLLSGIAGDDWYIFNLNDGTDTIFDASSGGVGAGTDRVVINAISGPALATLTFERIPTFTGNAFVDELRISYTGGVINVTDHYNTSIGSMDQMQFLGGASFQGYSLGTGVYNIVADGFSPTNGTGGNDAIAGSAGSETLTGAGGNDLLFGNGLNDTLNGGTGNDLLVGGAGNDTYVFALTGDGTDTISEAGGGTDGITIAVGGAAMTALNFERSGNNLVLTYNGQQATVVNHYVAGQAVEQVTFTGGGTYLGYALGTTPYTISTDINLPLDGTASADVIASASTVGDTLNGSTGNDLLFGNGLNDTINGGDGNDLLVGGTGTDILNGGNNDDVLVGDVDADTLNGDAGDDRFVYTVASDSTLSAMDTINGFMTGGPDDAINIDAFDFTGLAAVAIVQTSPAAFTSSNALDFFNDGGTDRAVVVEYFGGDAQVYVDANKDGDFTVANDLVIRLNGVGVNTMTVGDFVFG